MQSETGTSKSSDPVQAQYLPCFCNFTLVVMIQSSGVLSRMEKGPLCQAHFVFQVLASVLQAQDFDLDQTWKQEAGGSMMSVDLGLKQNPSKSAGEQPDNLNSDPAGVNRKITRAQQTSKPDIPKPVLKHVSVRTTENFPQNDPDHLSSPGVTHEAKNLPSAQSGDLAGIEAKGRAFKEPKSRTWIPVKPTKSSELRQKAQSWRRSLDRSATERLQATAASLEESTRPKD